MSQQMKITYATISADNEELQSAFDRTIERVRSTWLGEEVPMFINGERVYSTEKVTGYSPIDTELLLYTAQQGIRDHSRAAIAAAEAAFPIWRALPWQERVAKLRHIAEAISANSLDLSALMILEVGKSRLEALGEVEEAADLIRYYVDDMEKNDGYVRELGKLNPDDVDEYNYSILRPYGVWAVISPFNFPLALSVAPVAAALIAGNTVVFKGAPEARYMAWKMTELFEQANLPPGAFNSVIGPDESVGQELLDNPGIDGWTFTGSYAVGMKVLQAAHSGGTPKPAIIEMGGKNPTIISEKADLDKAALGVMRAAFGLDGQKCSACSRVYVQESAYASFRSKLAAQAETLRIGDPTERETYMGTVIDRRAYDRFRRAVEIAERDGQVVAGGQVLVDGALKKGYFVTPTIIEGLPEEHELVRNELFIPIVHLAPFKTLEEAMTNANRTEYGLTAGFFSEDQAEIDWFLENIQAGTIYVNRAAGATTGAWPGIQAFGGWKSSGSSGKAIGSFYTLPLYMREQSRTLIG